MNLKKYLITISFTFFILFAWRMTYSLDCSSLLLPLIYALVISYSFIEIRMREKECFKNCFIKENTIWASIVISPYFTSIFYIVLSLFYTFTFMYSILSYGMIFYGVIFIYIIIAHYIYKYIMSISANIINERQKRIFSREITIKISSIILFISYSLYFMYEYEPLYLKDTIEATLLEATKSVGSNCTFIDYIVRFQVEIDATILYITKMASSTVNTNDMNNMIWIFFITMNAMSILGLNRFIIQIIYMIDKNQGKE